VLNKNMANSQILFDGKMYCFDFPPVKTVQDFDETLKQIGKLLDVVSPPTPKQRGQHRGFNRDGTLTDWIEN
jgi:hypothetical protein